MLEVVARVVWHYLLRSRGSGGRERGVDLQTAVVEHTARAMPPSPEVMPHDTIGDAVSNLLALRFAPRSGAQGRRRRRRRRSAAKPERMVPEVADVSCGTTSCAAGGSGGRERSDDLQTAVVKHTARAMPPSPEVMPHETIGEVVANLLALRFAPRSGAQKKAERSAA